MSSLPQEQRTRRDAALKLFVTINRASDSFMKAAFSDDPLGQRLSHTEFAILEALLTGGALHQCDVASRILKSRGNISVAVQRLVEKQMVDRVPDPEDRRHTKISLTEDGERLIREVFPRVAAAIEKACGMLSSKELDEYIRLNKKLGLGEPQ